MSATDNSWVQHAACSDSGYSVDLWFPQRGDTTSERLARSVCESCPVRFECLQENIDERDGIYGGTSGRQRRALRRELNKTGRSLRHVFERNMRKGQGL